MAEIKPFEPETDNAGEGINWNVSPFLFYYPRKQIVDYQII